MADKRTWFKMDVSYFDNPKVEPLVEENPRAVILHMASIAYARRHTTDGVVPVRTVLRQAYATQSDMDELLRAGLMEEAGDARSAVVHDFLEHQQSAAEVAEQSERGKRAAGARWNADGNADRMQDALPSAMQREKREKREREKHATHAPLSRRGASRTIPDDWRPTDTHRTYAEERGLDLSTEAFRFRNHAIANDRRAVRWDAAFSNWLTKAKPSTPSGVDKRPEGWR